MSAGYLKNFSYLFMPFTLEQPEQFPAFFQRLTEENGWHASKLENRYLHQYVLEKLSWNAESSSPHFVLDEKFAAEKNLQLGADYTLKGRKYKDLELNFQVAGVELFTFPTSICVLTFELRFPEEYEPKQIAAAQYYLRKISAERICLLQDGEDARGVCFADMAKGLMEAAGGNMALDFFFYAPPKNEKANFLTYVDVPKKESYQEDLFYLKWCYSEGFDYDEFCSDDSENYQASKTVFWGITVSAAACLVHRSESQKAFIEGTFQKNFRKYYLSTYILLLHQKYTMYRFLTKMSVGLDGNLVQLESYKSQLFEFETRYMFGYITEVPQYQRFYQRVRKMFALDKLFADVQEPLLQLAEIKKQKAEDEQRAYDYRINTALTTLSLLTIVSALTDASGITANLTWLIPEAVSKIIQLVVLIGVAAVSIYMLIRLLFLKRH